MKSGSFGKVIIITSLSMLSMFLIFSFEILAPKHKQIKMLQTVSLQVLITSTNPCCEFSDSTIFMCSSKAHFLIQLHCRIRVGLINSVTKFLLRVRQRGPYCAELMAHFPTLNSNRIGESGGRLAKIGPFWTRASWMRSELVTMTNVRWPICMVKIGPYLARKSRTTYMNGRF